MIVDAHQHLWDPERRTYPWMTGPATVLRRRFGLDELRAVTAATDVSTTVAVQAAADEAETRELLETADRSGGLIGGVVGWVDLTAEDVPARLARLREAPGGSRLVGVRHQVEDEPDRDWLARPDVQRGLRAVADGGLAYDVLVRADQLADATRALRAVEGLRVILDHAAKPPLADDDWSGWTLDLRAFARVDGAHCKLSGLWPSTDGAPDRVARMRRCAQILLDAFDPERIVFGSDWPVSTLAQGYDQVIADARANTEDLSGPERRAVLGGNAVRFYGLPPRHP